MDGFAGSQGDVEVGFRQAQGARAGGGPADGVIKLGQALLRLGHLRRGGVQHDRRRGGRGTQQKPGKPAGGKQSEQAAYDSDAPSSALGILFCGPQCASVKM